jgi:hypothetical protein
MMLMRADFMRGGFALAGLLWLGVHASPCVGQEEEPLLKPGRTRAMAMVQAQYGVSRAQQALEVLTTSDSIEALESAGRAVMDSYVYLRMAAETTTRVAAGKRSRDLILEQWRDQLVNLRMKHIFPCASRRENVVRRDQGVIRLCLETLSAGIPQLEGHLIMMPP